MLYENDDTNTWDNIIWNSSPINSNKGYDDTTSWSGFFSKFDGPVKVVTYGKFVNYYSYFKSIRFRKLIKRNKREVQRAALLGLSNLDYDCIWTRDRIVHKYVGQRLPHPWKKDL